MGNKKKSFSFNDLFVNNEFALDSFLKNHKAYLTQFENDSYGFEYLCLQNISDANALLKAEGIELSDDWVYAYRQDCESKRTLAQKESAYYLMANSIRHFCRALEHFEDSTSSNRTAGLPTYFLCQGTDLKGYAYGLLKIDIEKIKKLGAHEKLGGGKPEGAFGTVKTAIKNELLKNSEMSSTQLWSLFRKSGNKQLIPIRTREDGEVLAYDEDGTINRTAFNVRVSEVKAYLKKKKITG